MVIIINKSAFLKFKKIKYQGLILS